MEEGPKKSLPREPPGLTTLDSHPRLSMATPARIALGSAVAGLIGFSLGATQGGQAAQLRFRAEHAHKMPDSTTGWYLYHKTKNYHAMQGGIREGMRMGARTGFWSFMALSLESTVDRFRGASDMFSTIIASLSVAGGFSLWRKCNPSINFHDARTTSSPPPFPLPAIKSSFPPPSRSDLPALPGNSNVTYPRPEMNIEHVMLAFLD